jgi:hypothetical protein
MCSPEGSAAGGAGGGVKWLLDGAGGGGRCTYRVAGTFLFFGDGLSAPAAGNSRLGADTLFFAGGLRGGGGTCVQ